MAGDGRARSARSCIKHFEPLGAKGFCYGGGFGFRGVLSNKRAGVRARRSEGPDHPRSPVPTLVEVFKQFGANPVPMIWGEVYMAVRQGTVDGLELPVTDRGLRQVPRDHQVLLEDAALLSGRRVWLMAKAKYDGLPADLKKVIDETMTASCAQHRQDELKAEVEGLAAMKAKGVQINDVKDLKLFQERAQPVWKFLEQKAGKELVDR